MSYFLRFLVLLTCATALFAQSQANTGTIEGAINDPSGKTIPGAEVTVQDLTGGGDHYTATVVAAAFRGQGPVDRHRMVYAALGTAIVELAGNLPYDVQRLAHELYLD